KHAHDAIHGVPAQPVMREVRPAQPTRSPAPRPFTAEPEHAPPEHAPLSEAAADPVVSHPIEDAPAHHAATHHAATHDAPLHSNHSYPTAADEGRVVYEGELEPELEAAAEAEVEVETAAPPLISSIAAEHARQVREELAAQEAPVQDAFFSPAPERSANERSSRREIFDPAASSGVEDYLAGARPSGEIALRFSYTTAAIAGVGIVLGLVIVYVIASAGHKKANRYATDIVQPGVLNVAPSGTDNSAPAATPVKPATDDRLAPRADAGGAQRTLGLETLGHPIPVPTSVKRVIGLQYVVLLSFPRADDANELVKFLADNGVPATAEKALPGYSPSWYSVVTTRGFDHVRKNPDYDSYVAALGKLMQKYARGSKFRTFQPDVYSWRGN
ncbi:MAG: hypothetical protein ACTHLZ_17265, partial [Tepidisphaeraceae bacterium]